ncbi:hypothetical protein CARUB_v10002523mg [Capsella rubella]|uniref:Uncharacterized protein n=1 Tax=Capsella rubella TaxID=81985 RepID=R0HAK6_9BRAS|nr:hypothetical protein CARUB_v10002523mg [Capsella rubella]
MIETISGKRNTGFYEPEKSLSLLGHKGGRWIELLDQALQETEAAPLPNPRQPAFVLRRCPSSSKASSSTKPETFSETELTTTLEDGR